MLQILSLFLNVWLKNIFNYLLYPTPSSTTQPVTSTFQPVTYTLSPSLLSFSPQFLPILSHHSPPNSTWFPPTHVLLSRLSQNNLSPSSTSSTHGYRPSHECHHETCSTTPPPTTSSQQLIHDPCSPILLSEPNKHTHSMRTHALNQIFKPRILSNFFSASKLSLALDVEPRTEAQALKTPHWHKALESEYQALLLITPGNRCLLIPHKMWLTANGFFR